MVDVTSDCDVSLDMWGLILLVVDGRETRTLYSSLRSLPLPFHPPGPYSLTPIPGRLSGTFSVVLRVLVSKSFLGTSRTKNFSLPVKRVGGIRSQRGRHLVLTFIRIPTLLRHSVLEFRESCHGSYTICNYRPYE